MADLFKDFADDATLTDVGANARKVVETSQQGTPALQFILVDADENFATNYTNSNSIYAQAVNVIQGFMETYVVGKPTSDGFVVIVNENTANSFDSAGANENGYAVVEAALNNITGVSNAVLADKALEGNGLA